VAADRIDRMYAFIAEDETGEGLTGFLSVGGVWMPMVAADEARVDALREIAQSVATASGKQVRLCVFERRVELETIQPASFRCPRCGKVSVHPEDIRNAYCGACHAFVGRR